MNGLAQLGHLHVLISRDCLCRALLAVLNLNAFGFCKICFLFCPKEGLVISAESQILQNPPLQVLKNYFLKQRLNQSAFDEARGWFFAF